MTFLALVGHLVETAEHCQERFRLELSPLGQIFGCYGSALILHLDTFTLVGFTGPREFYDGCSSEVQNWARQRAAASSGSFMSGSDLAGSLE